MRSPTRPSFVLTAKGEKSARPGERGGFIERLVSSNLSLSMSQKKRMKGKRMGKMPGFVVDRLTLQEMAKGIAGSPSCLTDMTSLPQPLGSEERFARYGGRAGRGGGAPGRDRRKVRGDGAAQRWVETGGSPNEIMLVAVISVCGELEALGHGVWAHAYVVKRRLTVNCIVAMTLVEMYAGCGKLDLAKLLFSCVSAS
ncbi:hypothetical protein ABZP36_015121 [Zizania latifolia]